MYEIEVKSAFEAAHYIRNYPGKCARLHGHNWTVAAIVRGNDLDDLGMLIDFKVLKGELNRVLEEFDHSFLNEHETFAKDNPTAENLARIIFERLNESLGGKLYAVRVHESPNSSVTYYLRD